MLPATSRSTRRRDEEQGADRSEPWLRLRPLYFETERMMDLLAEKLGPRPREVPPPEPDPGGRVSVPDADGRALRQRRLRGGARPRPGRRAVRGAPPRAGRARAEGVTWASASRSRSTPRSPTWATWRSRSTRSTGPSRSTCRSRGRPEACTVTMTPPDAWSRSWARRPQGQGHRPWWRRSWPTSSASTRRDYRRRRDGHVHARLVDLLGHVLEPLRVDRDERRRPRGAPAHGDPGRPRGAAPRGVAGGLEFRDGAVRPRDGRGPSYSLKELAGQAHWNSAATAGGSNPARRRRCSAFPRRPPSTPTTGSTRPTPTASSPR